MTRFATLLKIQNGLKKLQSSRCMVFKCKRCGYETDDLSNFKKHLKRKIPCEATLENIDVHTLLQECSKPDSNKKCGCEVCGKLFASKSGFFYHMKTTQCANNQNAKLKKEIVELKKHVTTLQEPSTTSDDIVESTKHVTSLQKLSTTSDEIFSLDNETESFTRENFIALQLELQYYKNRKTEIFYQLLLESVLDGGHKKLSVGVTDITTSDCHAEIKEWKSWKEAVGQLNSYNVVDPKRNLAVYLFGVYSPASKSKAVHVLTQLNIRVYEFKEEVNGDIEILQLPENKLVYTYSPKKSHVEVE